MRVAMATLALSRVNLGKTEVDNGHPTPIHAGSLPPVYETLIYLPQSVPRGRRVWIREKSPRESSATSWSLGQYLFGVSHVLICIWLVGKLRLTGSHNHTGSHHDW